MKPKGFIAAVLFLATLIFYLITLQPGLAWGDGVRLQREAITAESFILAEIVDVDFAPDPLPFARLGVAAWDHPLYVMLAHGLSRVAPGPGGLWLVNAVSAFFAAAASALFFLLAGRYVRLTAALLASLALIFSHTFWWHAVTPEVYSLFAFLLLLALYWLDSFEHGASFAALIGAAFALGLGISNHLLAGLAAPALLLYLLLARRSPRYYIEKPVQLLWLALAFLLGLAPYLVQLARMLRTFPLSEVMGPAVGATFLNGSLALSLSGMLQSVVTYLIFLSYQFLLTGLVLGLAGWWLGRHAYAPFWNKALAFYIVYLAFALVYQVSDQFAFFLAPHIFWAMAIGMGIDALLTAFWPDRRRWAAAALALPILLMPLFYAAAPDLLRAAGVTEATFGVPQVGIGTRDGLRYYVDPNKYGDVSAEIFARQTMANLDPGALVLAEWYADTDEYFVLRYLAVVEEARPDVTLFGWPREDPFDFDTGLASAAVEANLAERPVYLASLSETFYDAPRLLSTYCIVLQHNLYRVYPRHEAEGRPCLTRDTLHLAP